MAGFPGLSFSEADGRLIAHNQPLAQRPPLDVKLLREALDQAGYGKWFVFEEALAMLAARCNAAIEAFDMPVGERRDGSFSIEVAPDALSAWVTLVPAYGGKAVKPDSILQALGEAGVVFGIDDPALEDLCAHNVAARIVAALGLPPVHGEDARFEQLVEVNRDRAPKLNEQGLIDFRELGEILVIEAERPLMRRIPATPGVNGRNVHDAVIPAKPGHDQKFADKLTGVSFAPDDPNLLRSAVKGQPVSVGNGMLVEQILHLKSVDMASGNITFDGSVHVEGDIMHGMQVRASGDIVVDGVVEGGILEAGGNVQTTGGIIANARVRSAGSVAARFVEHSEIHAGTVISIDDMVLQSDLQADNQIMIGIKSPQRGRLVGGSTRAMLLVQVPILGGEASGNTHVQVGVNPVLEARHQELLHLAEKQHKDEENLRKLVHHLAKTGDKNTAERAKASWKQAVQAWAQTLLEQSEVEKQLALIAGARIEVTQEATGAVDLAFGKRSRLLQHSYDAGVFTLLDDKLIFTDPTGHALNAD